ncbi:hypothetical protein CHELA41_21944 [Hyphomicrobiales bacterium]|nr:hypothetical protein CHELA41_21944 [Hyphomicrobiales bacterium]
MNAQASHSAMANVPPVRDVQIQQILPGRAARADRLWSGGELARRIIGARMKPQCHAYDGVIRYVSVFPTPIALPVQLDLVCQCSPSWGPYMSISS